MSLETALAENTAALQALAAILTAQQSAAVTTAPAPAAKVEGPKSSPAATAPTQPTAKAEAAAAPEKTVAASTPDAASAAAAAPASTAAPVTYEQVGKAITDMVKADRSRVVAALAKFGVKKGPELTPEQYADFLAELA